MASMAFNAIKVYFEWSMAVRSHENASAYVCVCECARHSTNEQRIDADATIESCICVYVNPPLFSVLHKNGRRRRYINRSFGTSHRQVDFLFVRADAQCPIQNQMDHMLG